MSKAYDKVMAGLEDTRGYLSGARGGFAVHDIEVPEPDVVTIRGKTGPSQPAFANVAEQRRSHPRRNAISAGSLGPPEG